MPQQDFILFMQEVLQGNFAIAPVDKREEMLQQLADAINNMISTDFSRLISILYRLDIDERLLKKELQLQSDVDAGVIIAALIEKRQLEKWKTRQQFKSSSDIPDDEKW
ncbi:MAG: hypothetical protein QM731_18620 [Chitinophagaceae bacterium]